MISYREFGISLGYIERELHVCFERLIEKIKQSRRKAGKKIYRFEEFGVG